VRASTEADVVRCAEIYGHHVLHGTASFEVDPPDLAEMKKTARRRARSRPAAPRGRAWRPGPGLRLCRQLAAAARLQFSVEDSIYIDKDAVGQGVGRALLPVLIEHCTALGKRQMWR